MAGKGRDPIVELAGSSIEVYLYLLEKRGPAGVREVQRALGFRSPSTAKHHLERLVELGLAEKREGGYVALPPRGLLGEYLVIRGRLVPRSTVLTGFLASSTLAYILLPGRDPVASVVLAVATLLSAWNTYTLYKAIPRRRRSRPKPTGR